MAWRRLARDAAASLRCGAAPPIAPTRAFSSAAASCSSRAPVASPARDFLKRYSNLALQARASKIESSLAARVALGVRAQLSGLNLHKGLGTGTVLTIMLHQGTAAAAAQERPSNAITGPPSGVPKNELSAFWPLVRKLQLPVGLIFLIVSGWQNPEIRQREMGQNYAVRKEEVLHTRKVDVEDYKFISIGTVELVDGRVLHLIGMLGSWWIYRVSYVK